MFGKSLLPSEDDSSASGMIYRFEVTSKSLTSAAMLFFLYLYEHRYLLFLCVVYCNHFSAKFLTGLRALNAVFPGSLKIIKLFQS